LRFASLGSGSEGNGLIIESGDARLLVDCGFSLKNCQRRLQRLGLEPGDLSAILVTHEHDDHVAGVFDLAREADIPVWLTHGTLNAVTEGARDATRDLTRNVAVHRLHGELALQIAGIDVLPYTVPHDAREPVQYRFGDGNVRLGVLTDIGHPTAHVAQVLSGCEALVLECNYDPQMLDDGPYPVWLKRRVGGKQGHLSNQQSAELLAVLDRSRLRHLVAAHLSRTNNTPALARGALVEVLGFEPAWLEMASQTDGFGWREV
jgi:phosphoribosyl 1,2-cyclic phosphodiesterase